MIITGSLSRLGLLANEIVTVNGQCSRDFGPERMTIERRGLRGFQHLGQVGAPGA